MLEPSMLVVPTAPRPPSDSVVPLSFWNRGSYSGTANPCNDIWSTEEETLPMLSYESPWTTCASITATFPGPTMGSESIPRYAQNSPSVNNDSFEFQPLRTTLELSKCQIEPVKPSKTAAQKRYVHSHQCQSCDRSFRYPKDVLRHERSVHAWQSSKWYFCPVSECRRSTQGFSRKDKFFQHIKTHTSNFDKTSDLEQIAHNCYRAGDCEMKYSSITDRSP